MLHIVIDSAEQLPYTFSGRSDVYRIFDSLETGDYSVDEFRNQITVERKSCDDFYKSIKRDHDRFFEELVRMRNYRFRALVIETDARSLFNPDGHPHANQTQDQVWGNVMAICVDLDVPVFLAGARSVGEEFTYRFLEKSARTASKLNEAELLPRSALANQWRCGLCGLTRRQALGMDRARTQRDFVKPAEYRRRDGKIEFGKVLLVCWQCRQAIKNGTHRMPAGFRWKE